MTIKHTAMPHYSCSTHKEALDVAEFLYKMRAEMLDSGKGRLDLDDAINSINYVLMDYDHQRLSQAY